MTRLDATGDSIPITYQGRNGKQYVVIAAGGTNRFRMIAKTAEESADSLIAFALPDTPQARNRAPESLAARASAQNRVISDEFKAAGPPLPDGNGKEIVARICTNCHGTAVFSKMRMSRAGWDDEVTAMVEKGAEGTEDEFRKVVEYLVKNFGK